MVAAVDSAPLRTVVEEMLATSDNNTAELLVKEIGLAAGGAGTREAGLAAIRTTLERWGVPTAGMVLDDGSGLSNENRVTCGAFVDVLARSGPNQALGAGLPVAGRSGTLTDVFTDSPVTGRLRAKTGTLGNAPFNADPPAVKALSGYLPVGGGAGATIEFSLLLNGPGPLIDQSLYRPIWDALVATLASYPTGPDRRRTRPVAVLSAKIGRSGRFRGQNGRSGVAVMAMFPLGTVLLPGGVLPLHVFEPRYRQLVIDCLADDTDDPEFGVTLIERGSEVGGGDQRAGIGVVARMVQVEALPGGRYAVVAVGTRRFRVIAWLPDDPYPLADVDEWRDLDPDAPELPARVAATTARLREILDLAARFGEVPSELSISEDPLLASYHLSGLAPLGPADRYRLLSAAVTG